MKDNWKDNLTYDKIKNKFVELEINRWRESPYDMDTAMAKN